MKKLLSVLALTVLVLSLASCGGEKADYTFGNISEEFVLLSEAYVPSTLPAPYKAGEGFYDEITGKGVLFGDTESEISIKSDDGITVTVTIDGKRINMYAEGLEGAQIVDLDTNDNMNELAIYSAGPSMDPSIHFVRFDGEKASLIYFVESDDDVMKSFVPTSMYGYHGGTEADTAPTYGAVYTNKQGKILHSMQYIGFTDPRYALSYYQLEGDCLVLKELTPDNLPKDFKTSAPVHAFFTPMDTAPEKYEDPKLFNNFENPREFGVGTEFKILGYGKCYNYYAFFVEIEGEKGVMTFWTGD